MQDTVASGYSIENQRNRILSTMNYSTYTTPELKRTHTWGSHTIRIFTKGQTVSDAIG